MWCFNEEQRDATEEKELGEAGMDAGEEEEVLEEDTTRLIVL